MSNSEHFIQYLRDNGPSNTTDIATALNESQRRVSQLLHNEPRVSRGGVKWIVVDGIYSDSINSLKDHGFLEEPELTPIESFPQVPEPTSRAQAEDSPEILPRAQCSLLL
jgi:hypothetical protein